MARLFVPRRLRREMTPDSSSGRTLLRIEALVIEALWSACAGLPIERASDLGDLLGRRIGPCTRKQRHVLENFRIAFPERDDAWLRRTARSMWGQIGRVLAEYPHLSTISGPRLRERIELVMRFDPALLRRPPGLIFLAPHQANWNLPATTGALCGVPMHVVYAEQSNPFLEAGIARHRNRMPCGFVHVRDTVRRGLRILRTGEHLGMHVDHRIDQGEPIPFFGRPALTTTVPARMAIRLGTALVPCRIERLEGVRFRISLNEPIRPRPELDDPTLQARDMMQRLHRHFERWIRERPDDWCCPKRRWPKGVASVAEPAAETAPSSG